MYITERCVFVLKEDGLHLTEIAPGIDLQTQILDQMEFEPIIDRDENGEIKLILAALFETGLVGLKEMNTFVLAGSSEDQKKKMAPALWQGPFFLQRDIFLSWIVDQISAKIETGTMARTIPAFFIGIPF